MPDDNFDTNLLRMIAAELHYQTVMQVAREMYGKSYFSLGVGERQIVDQNTFGQVAANFQALTPEFLAQTKTQFHTVSRWS